LLGSIRTDPSLPLVFVLIEVDDWLAWDHVPPQERLGHRINLVVMGAIREGRAFFDEVVDPRRLQRMGKVDIAGLDERADSHGARHLSAFRVHRQDARDFVCEHLDHRRSVGLILY
jgi:hypothetical protein